MPCDATLLISKSYLDVKTLTSLLNSSSPFDDYKYEPQYFAISSISCFLYQVSTMRRVK
ncbi:hypothetical protein CCACVL1_01802, partial [Corchorus capsularis]